MKTKILNRFQQRLRSSSEHVVKHRSYYAQKFLDFAGEPPWTEATVQDFMRALETEGYSRGSQRTIYGIVKTVFTAAKSVTEEEKTGLISSIDPSDPTAMAQVLKVMATPAVDWPMPRRSAPIVRDGDELRPAASVDEIAAMIVAAKTGRLEPHEAAFVALSTTYGLRREELARVRPEDISDNTIFINTVKGGMARLHQIPEVIIPLINRHDFRHYSLFQFSWFYHRIEYKSGIQPRPGTGWHSPRRTLDTLLMDQLPLPAVRLFLRWKVKGSSEMPLRYYSKELEQNDREVFAVHPFLPMWE